MKIFTLKRQNLAIILTALLSSLKVKVNTSTVDSCLQEHPDYPSIRAVSDCLDQWRIENNTYSIGRDQYDPKLFAYPLLAYLPKRDFILVESIENKVVRYLDVRNRSSYMKESDFLELWNGIFLYAEGSPESGTHLMAKVKKQWDIQKIGLSVLLITSFSTVVALFTSGYLSFSMAPLVIIKLLGLIISILLLVHSINDTNAVVSSFCGFGGNKGGCNKILQSSASKVFPWLSWSEVGFFYFVGSLSTLIIMPSLGHGLALLNLFCLPYTIWSIGYQFYKKKWCTLCCSIQVLLWCEFLAFIIRFEYSVAAFAFSDFIIFLLCFLIPASAWFSIKPIFIDIAKVEPLRSELKKFKYNKELFYQTLYKQPWYTTDQSLMPVTLGTDDPKMTITIISNPFCEPCARAHQKVDDLLHYHNELQFKLIFATSTVDDDPAVMFVRHIVSMEYSGQKNKVPEALSAWYHNTNRRYESWSAMYPTIILPEAMQIEQKQKTWCDIVDVVLTPTILINGYKLPEPYRIEDLKYLIS